MCLGRRGQRLLVSRGRPPRETAVCRQWASASSPPSGPKRTSQDAPRVPEQMGPSVALRGTVRPALTLRGSFLSRALAQGSVAPWPLGLCVSATTGQRHSRLPCRNKALCSGSLPRRRPASLSTHRVPWSYRRSPLSPGGTSPAGAYHEELRAAAKGCLRRGSTSPAGWQSAQVHYRGRDLRRGPRPSAKLNGILGTRCDRKNTARLYQGTEPREGTHLGWAARRPRAVPAWRQKGKVRADVTLQSVARRTVRPHGSKAAGCSQASLDQEDLFV